MQPLNKKTNAIIKAAKNKADRTLAKVQKTIDQMQQKSLSINFNSVAKLAGVSKTWLYKPPEICKQIKELRKTNSSKILQHDVLHNKYEKVKLENKSLKNRNSVLRNQIKALKKQLEIVYGELYEAKQNPKYIE